MNKNHLYIASFALLLMIGHISAKDHFWTFDENEGNIACDSGTGHSWGGDKDDYEGRHGDHDGDNYEGRHGDRDRDNYEGRHGDRDGDNHEGRHGDRDGDNSEGRHGDRDWRKDGDRHDRDGDRDRDDEHHYEGRDGDKDGGRFRHRDGDRDKDRDGDEDRNRGRYRGRVNACLHNAFWRDLSKVGRGAAVGITGDDDSYVDFGNQVAEFGTQDFTVAFWIQTREKLELFDLIGNRETEDLGNFFNVRMDCEGSVTAEICEDAEGTNYMGIRAVQKGLNDGNWHHIAVVRCQGTLSLYIDGDFSIYGTNTCTTNLCSRNPLKLGRSLVDKDTCRFSPNALFDDVAIYYSALSYVEIKELYSCATNE